jgi:hypothetical protein
VQPIEYQSAVERHSDDFTEVIANLLDRMENICELFVRKLFYRYAARDNSASQQPVTGQTLV